MRRKPLFAALALVGFLVCGLSLLAAETIPEGWKETERREYTRNDLYGYIDGGAEIFLEYGFQKLTLIRYGLGKEELDVELYRMDNPEGALGIYLAKAGRETPLTDFPTRNSGDRYQIMAVKGSTFALFNNPEGKEALFPALINLATEALSSIPDEKGRDLFAELLPPGFLAGTARLFRGPLGLQPIITLGDGDILLQKGTILGVLADYAGPEKGEIQTLAVVSYPSAQEAKKAFDNLIANLDSYLKKEIQSEDSLTFKDFSGKFGTLSLSGSRLLLRFNISKI